MLKGKELHITNQKKVLLSSKALLFLFGIVFLFSCSNKTFSTEEKLYTFLKDTDNGYLQKKNINGVDFSVLYKPTDLLVNQELGNDKDIDSKEKSKKIKALREKYGKYLYFNLSMSKNNKELLSTVPNNRNEFGAMVNQLAFGMNDKVHLFNTKKDTIELLDYVYPRMYGMSKSTSMLFVYPRDKEKLKEDELTFTVEDLGTYTGEVKFKFQTKNIKNQPELKL